MWSRVGAAGCNLDSFDPSATVTTSRNGPLSLACYLSTMVLTWYASIVFDWVSLHSMAGSQISNRDIGSIAENGWVPACQCLQAKSRQSFCFAWLVEYGPQY